MNAAGIALVVIGIISFFVIGPFALPFVLVGLLLLGFAFAASRRAVEGNEKAVDPIPEGPDA